MTTLSKRQKQVLDFIGDFVDEHGYAPSYREIAENFGLSSAATVAQHVNALQTKGFLNKQWNGSRSIELAPKQASTHPTHARVVELPLMGAVAAGSPIDAIENPEPVEVPESLLGPGENYVLQAAGDSMIEDAICDGDLLVVNARNTAQAGQTVIALVDGESATVKRFHPGKNGMIELRPANEKYKPIRVRGDRVQIRGIVVGVMRKYGRN